jgi:hypothetical protein
MLANTDILEMISLGQVQPLTAAMLPAAWARQEDLNARFAAAMESAYVGGNRIPDPITASATKSAKPDRARAVSLLLKASRDSTRRRNRNR